MNGPRRGGWRPQLGWLALAFAAAAGGVVLWVTAPAPAESSGATAPANPVVAAAAPQPLPTPVTAPSASAAAPLPPVAASSPAPQTAQAREPYGDLTPDISVFVNKGEQPTMAEVIERLHQAGEYGGLGAFSPPGTRPPLVGLAVPEDFVLPEGYVRHYQATDDGQRIEAILMFAPDRQFVDASGNRIALPADRVVPPELAPPGLPMRRIEIPPPAPEPGK
jgi:hypothetical protein